ncbi:MAG: NifU family protein [Nocardioidaceae bacterium]
MEPDGDAHEPTDWRAAGERVEALLDASATGGAAARERAEELVALLSDLYGAGLQRIVEILKESGQLDDTVQKSLAADDLVASLLLVHGLHPHDVPTRVESALDSVRPYLGSHGGDVELLEVGGDGVVRLRLLGSCDGCPSSAVTLETAVEDAIRSAAPEVTSIEVEAADETATGGQSPSLISVESLRSRLGEPAVADAAWTAVPELGELSPGEIGGFTVRSQDVVACRLGETLYAYADQCPACVQSLAGATLERQLGGADATVVLTCPRCRAHYDVRKAGASLDGDDTHLRPLPLIERSGVPTVAVASEAVTS